MNGLQLSVLGFVALVLLFGCLQPYQAPPETGNGEPETNITPPATPPEPNVTVNVTEPAMNITENLTPGNGEPETPEPGPPETNLTISQLLAAELDGLPFPKEGSYSIVTYQWVPKELDADGKIITFDPVLQIVFDYKTQANLVGFAFKTYTPTEGGAAIANGVAIFKDESSYLEGLGPQQRVDIHFNVPGLENTLYDSKITSKKTLLDQKGRLLVIYGFESPYVG